jgi:ABC-type branched-subunit amino acid transport system ATPase component
MLEVAEISLSFGGFRALRSVSLVADRAAITGLIGPNGSGKSTLLNVVSGVLLPDRGEVRLDGRRLPFGRPEAVAAQGVGRTFQVPRLARHLSVFQNLMVGARHQPGERLADLFLRPGRVASAEQAVAERAWIVLGRLGLQHKANDGAGQLSGGQQKLLSMGVLLMADPDILLLDEPAAGVNPVLIEEQIALLKNLRAEGRTILLIEHNMDMVASVCDRVYVLDGGVVLAQGTPDEIRGNPQVVRSYLGELVDAP